MDFSAWWQWIINFLLPLIAKIAPVVVLIVNLPKIYAWVRGVIVRIEVKQFTPGLTQNISQTLSSSFSSFLSLTGRSANVVHYSVTCA